MSDLLTNIKLLSKSNIENKRVLLRVDFNVTMTPRRTIADDIRIIKALPTIELLLQNNNKVILISHLSRPKGREDKYSLRPIADYLQKAFPKNNIVFVDDFLSEKGQEQLRNQTSKDIILLENIRFYEGEQANSAEFAKQLAQLGDVYINDAFGVSHRNEASVFAIAKTLPSYCGLLLEKEIEAVTTLMEKPNHPVVAIIGGAKISTKITFLAKLIEVVDYLLLGGGIANTFLFAMGREIGKSLAEKNQIVEAKRIILLATEKQVTIVLPTDVVGLEDEKEKTYEANNIPMNFSIFDIGPQTEKIFEEIIRKAQTIVWNGPVGMCEDERFAKGTDFLFTAIIGNPKAFSLIGGGDTLACVSEKKSLEKISHLSTGGGAMLELVENGTLPGIEALRQ